MQANKYTCRHCGIKTSSFDCMCKQKMNEKNLWIKSHEKLDSKVKK